MKILDCTLRDGGYYTNWNFNKEIIDTYISSTNNLPIDYLELGYRNLPQKDYLGKYGYCPKYELEDIRRKSSKKLAIMLNEKSITPKDLDILLYPISSIIDMIRIAVDPVNIDRALILAKSIKNMGFEVGFNVMYMSKWAEMDGFLPKLKGIEEIVDLFCMVDSFGGITPEEIKTIITNIRKYTNVPIGFHGHNNLQLGLINTITAIENGVDYVDATITGMGRGAGNLKMELLLTYLNKHKDLSVDFNVLSDAITAFIPLLNKYHWGTNLPYMLSGANSFPQKTIMDWVNNRTYSFNSIVRALNNKQEHKKDNAKFPILQQSIINEVLLIGGGTSVIEHQDAIRRYLLKKTEMAIIFVTSRHASLFNSLPNIKYYILVGSEAKRMKQNISESQFNGKCILAPYPRTMGTEVPSYATNNTFELERIEFTKHYKDSCTTISLQLAISLGVKNIYSVGYDGYSGEILSEKEMNLSIENRTIFEDYISYTKKSIISLTPSLYKSLNVVSIFQFL